MTTTSNRKKPITPRDRDYLNRDFGALRQELVSYASFYYSDYIKDFTEPSVASMFVDLAAYTADVTSFYLDYQFKELNLETAKDANNIQRLVRMAGYKIRGASPAFCNVDFYISVPAQRLPDGTYEPRRTYLPVIRSGTSVRSNSGITFELSENLDFAKTTDTDSLVASYRVLERNPDTTPKTFALKLTGICTSGRTFTEIFPIEGRTPFLSTTLAQPNVIEILSVSDTNGNDYYEVESLTHDTVYIRDSNLYDDSDEVQDSLGVVSAPYRFIVSTDLNASQTTLTFGAGTAQSLEADVIADPADFSLPLFGDRKTFSYTTIDPNELLSTRTLGIAPENTSITVKYRAGGGLNNNAPAQTINTVSSLLTQFSDVVPATIVASIRASATCGNVSAAFGGTDAPTIDEIRSLAILYKNSQSRIVSKEDLIARIYTMPTNFGRVFRVGVTSNPVNPLSSIIYVVSRDSAGKLQTTPDTTKRNIAKYINEFRVISDAFDIIDAPIINMGVRYTISVSRDYDKSLVISSINSKLTSFFSITNFYINQPVVVADIQNTLLSEPGVLGIGSLSFVGLSGDTGGLTYSSYVFNPDANTRKGVIVPPKGGIFEVKFPATDIIGSAF
jgi:hypothetical protein